MVVFFFNQKTAYEMRISDWSSDVCSSDLLFDYHVDNLLWLPERPGAAACGLLDFQDAVIAPVTFDLVSLLEDVRRDVAPEIAAAAIARYLAAFPGIDSDAYAAAYSVVGAQRNCRIAGTFTRLWKRDGKPGYLRFMKRVWRLIRSAERRVGKEWVRTCRSRWAAYHSKKK